MIARHSFQNFQGTAVGSEPSQARNNLNQAPVQKLGMQAVVAAIAKPRPCSTESN
jgi:hypothetical protein